MQKSNTSIAVSGIGTVQDKMLYQIKSILQMSYWRSSEGVFNFQFISDDVPLTNTISPHVFQLIRYTPTDNYQSFQLVIPGRLNNDGTFEYGGGLLGMLISKNSIKWSNGSIWTAVNSMPNTEPNKLDLRKIQAQAYLDSMILMGDIYNKKYLY